MAYRPYPRYLPQNNSGFQYQSQFQPAIDPQILQNYGAKRDAKFNLAQQYPNKLVDVMNQQALAAGDRAKLTDMTDRTIKDIQRTVEEDYGGDWAQALPDITSKVTRQQGDIMKAAQSWKEYQPYRQMLMQAQAEGKGIWDPGNVAQLTETGFLEDAGDGRFNVRQIPQGLEIFDKSKILKDIDLNVSKAINESMGDLGVSRYNGLLKTGNYEGMSDKMVEDYYSDKGDLLETQMKTIPQWDTQMKAKYGENWEDTNMEKAKEDFKNIVKSQTSLKLKNRYMGDPTIKKGRGGNGVPGSSLFENTESVTGQRVTPAAQSMLNKSGLSDITDVATVTESSAKKDPKLAPALEYKKKIAKNLDNDIAQYATTKVKGITPDIADKVPVALKNLPSGGIFGASDMYAGSFIIKNEEADKPIEEVMKDSKFIKERIKPLVDVLGVKTVGEFNKILEAANSYQRGNDYNFSTPSYTNFLEDKLEKSADNKEYVTEYNQVEPNKKVYETNMADYIDKTRSIIPESMKDRLPKELGNLKNWDLGVEFGADGGEIILHPTSAFSTDEDETEKKLKIPVRNLTPQVAFDLTQTGKMPSIWRDYIYAPSNFDNIKASEKLKGIVKDPKGEIIRSGSSYKLKVGNKFIDESFNNVYDAMDALYVLNGQPPAMLQYMTEYPKFRASEAKKVTAMQEEADIYRQQLVAYKQSLESQLAE